MKQFMQAIKEVDWDSVLLLLIVLALTVFCTVLVVGLFYKWFIGF